MSAAVAFALAAALHAGFQLTVTLLVYPLLLRPGHEDWVGVHARHSRTIAPLVGAVYLVLLAGGVLVVLEGPDPLTWLALVATGLALATTAALAAPLHGRLTTYDASLAARLLRVDRVRCAAAVVGALAAVAGLAG